MAFIKTVESSVCAMYTCDVITIATRNHGDHVALTTTDKSKVYVFHEEDLGIDNVPQPLLTES